MGMESAVGRHFTSQLNRNFYGARIAYAASQKKEPAMKLPRRGFLYLAAGAAAQPAFSRTATAQAYPTRPVRWIVGFAPGGGNDIVARLMGQWLSERLGQPVVIENRPGAATSIATETVVRAPPDGYTLLFVAPSSAINAILYEKLNFDFVHDIAPVASITQQPQIMLAVPSFPAKTTPELVDYAKAKSEQGQRVLARRRLHQSSRRRAVQDDDWRRNGSCAFQRQQPRADGVVGRTSGGVHRLASLLDRVHQERQVARAGGD
jgi:Tripartite tricarboxylate transporter family receptor